MSEQKITLPYPPSANRYWRVTRQGRTYISDHARQYKLNVATLARAAKLKQIDGDVVLHLDIYRPIKRGDLSNRIKILEDALQGIAYKDDSQIVEIVARRFEDKKSPRVEILLKAA